MKKLCIFMVFFLPTVAHGREKDAAAADESSILYPVHFDSKPAGAVVRVDGEVVCRSTPCSTMLHQGKSRVLMEAKWYFMREEDVDIKKDDRFEFVLEKQPHQVDALVLVSQHFALFYQAVDGIENAFAGSLQVVTMGEADDELEKLRIMVRNKKPKVIITVGARAVSWALRMIKDTPIVFCLVIQPDKHRLKTDVSTGIDVKPAPAELLRAVQTNFPALKRIGVVYDPEKTGGQVAEIHGAASELELEVIDRPVFGREEVPDALKEILKRAQALWLIRDSTVVTIEFFRELLKLQLEEKLPLIAWSQQFVKEGAFCAFSATRRQQGQKAAQLAESIIAGADPKDIPIQHPQGTLTINLDTGARLHYLPPLARDILPGNVFRFR